MVLTRTKLAVTGGLLLLAVGTFVVKQVCFTTVDDRWFVVDYQNLLRAPAGVLVVRPTHYAQSPWSGSFSASSSYQSGKYLPRLLGRNVSLDQVIAMAYQCPESRVLLLPGTPTNYFDFLVTVRRKPVERMQAAVKRKLGYTAHWQERETEVLQLKVQTPNAPGLRASSADRSNVDLKDGRLYFTRQPMERLPELLERVLGKPVQDKTGLTGFYDFSVAWVRGRSHSLDETALKNSLRELGLTCESESDSLRMMVVERVK
jgi:uncharacterized protein (TIGR03435 family)